MGCTAVMAYEVTWHGLLSYRIPAKVGDMNSCILEGLFYHRDRDGDDRLASQCEINNIGGTHNQSMHNRIDF